jgi:hypothetical protein
MDQGLRRKSVAHVMKPWTTAMAFRPRAQTEFLRQLCEGVARHVVANSDATFGDEESRSWSRHDAISLPGILLKRRYGRWMDGHMPRFSELRPSDGEDAMHEVHILPVQVHSLAYAHATHHEKAEESRVGVGAESFCGV